MTTVPDPIGPPALSDDERRQARIQAAIADAYDDWVEEVDQDPPAPSQNPTGPSEYPQFAYLLDASPEQQAQLQKAVSDAIEHASAG